MSRVRFTAQRVERHTCAVGKFQSFLWDLDAPGLGLRVTTTGAKSYIFQSRACGKSFRSTIGDPKSWTLSNAQNEARRLQMICDQGQDPRQVRTEQIATDAARKAATATKQAFDDAVHSLTARAVWDEYLKAPHPRWGKTHRQDHLNASQTGGQPRKHGNKITIPGPLTSLLHRPLASIDAQAITDWLSLEKSRRPTATLNAFRKFRSFIRWCSENEDYAAFVNTSCYSARKVTDNLPPKKTKENDCLQREQLPKWFEAVHSINNLFISAFLLTALITGARREELAILEWKNIDFTWNSLTLKDKVEGKRTIPLTPYISYVLRNLPRHNKFVFYSDSSQSGRIVEPRIAHKKALVAVGLPDVSIHGLRRSFKTLSEWVECPAGIVAQIMGHKPSGTAEKHYSRRSLDLLRVWHCRVEAWLLTEAQISIQASNPQPPT